MGMNLKAASLSNLEEKEKQDPSIVVHMSNPNSGRAGES